MIKYIGSKRALIPWILDVFEVIRRLTKANSVVDLFSGSARVSHALKSKGFEVIANDINMYAFVLAQGLVEADAREYKREKIAELLEDLNQTTPIEGWFTRTYAQEARFFHPKNAAKIEAIRIQIEEEFSEDPLLKSILLTSLLIAADKVDSTTGVQMAYLKEWAPRALNDIKLEPPPLLPGRGKALLGDALEVVDFLDADIFYLDPPYNQHSYLGNYHVWETLIRWDFPKTYGVARKRWDVKERKSFFNSKLLARSAMENLLRKINASHLVLSFSNEGFFSPEEIGEMLKDWGYVVRLERVHKRYVGALIGIYNPRGEKVGQPGHTKNKEFLFIATQDRKVYHELRESASSSTRSSIQPSPFG